MKTIKIYDGIKVTTSKGTQKFPDMTAFDAIHIPENCRTDLIRNLMCFHKVDLSDAYGGKTVILEGYKD